MFDVLIIGGGVSGVSCALLLGSAKNKPFASEKKIGIITHQKTSSLQNAVFNNVYGIAPGKLGSELLSESVSHLSNLYPHVEQIQDEKVISVTNTNDFFEVVTNKNTFKSMFIVVAIGSGNPLTLDGLEDFVIPHKKAAPEKNRIQLKNDDHKVAEGIYVAGTLAGHRSQLSIASGSGAIVAGDILTLWNDGNPVQVHDSLKK